MIGAGSPKQTVLETMTDGIAGAQDAENDLVTDLATAALETGSVAFEAREWHEAEALFQDATQILLRLPEQQRGFCDVFALHHRLAVCAFHTQEPAIAEQALMGLAQQPLSSNDTEHQLDQYDAAHLLAVLYIRTGQIDFARCECERALQGRRRHLGKHSKAALESTALIAHIYALLNNPARAKACLAMIPTEQRSEVEHALTASLRTAERAYLSANLVCTDAKDTNSTVESDTPTSSNSWSVQSLPTEKHFFDLVYVRTSQPQIAKIPALSRYSMLNGNGLESLERTEVTSIPSTGQKQTSIHAERWAQIDYDSAEKEVQYNPVVEMAPSPDIPKSIVPSEEKCLCRKAILRNLRCIPVDRLEEAVCNSDHSNLDVLLKKKKNGGFLRSKVQKALHSKRVTALHFAALFGEIEMAHRLLSAGFEINEVPELSTSRLTPLKFAIGARQVAMVEFLVANGAKPVEPDTWSTLVGQLMNRSWITSTMSVAQTEDLQEVPNNMIAIMHIWLKHGWNVNTACEASSGRTGLHQAVAFESGFYKWDSNLRITMTRFLCERGADPLKADAKGNTPYDMASVVDDRDLLPILEQRLRTQRLDGKISRLVDLPARPPSPVELFDRSTTVPPKPPYPDGGANLRFLQELDGGREPQLR